MLGIDDRLDLSLSGESIPASSAGVCIQLYFLVCFDKGHDLSRSGSLALYHVKCGMTRTNLGSCEQLILIWIAQCVQISGRDLVLDLRSS
jgi:hypothetical protein